MAGANTAQGANADAQAEASGKTADVEVSASGVETAPKAADFTATKMYRRGEEKTAETLEQFFALKFDGYTDRKPTKKS